MLLETTSKFRAESEIEAKNMIEQFRLQAAEKGYVVKKAGYEYKTRKSKDDCWLVSVTQVFANLWED